jgi:hypothetical protein
MAKKKIEDLRIRRVPKYRTFLLLGGVFGIVVAFIINSFATKTTGAPILGYLIIFCIGLGLGFGLIVALILDRVYRSKTQIVKGEQSR